MIWFVTLPLILGTWLWADAEGGMWWQAGLSVLCALALWQSPFRRWRATPLLWLLSLCLGGMYGSVRYRLQSPSSPTISPYVERAEAIFAQTALSPPHQGTVAAMCLGDRRQLSSEQRALFRGAGAQHLLALSGTHLGIFVTLLSVLVLRHFRFSRVRWLVLALSLILLWLYALMTGMPKSLLRAVLMTSLFLVGRYSWRMAPGHIVLGGAVWWMWLLDPLCVFDIGAQLSVAALVGLTTLYPSLQRHIGWHLGALGTVLRWAAASLSAWLFTMPLVMHYFGQFQPWQALVGIVLVPLTSGVLYAAVFVLLFAFLGLPTLSYALSWVQEGWMTLLDTVLRGSARLPLATVQMPTTTGWEVALLYLLLAVLWVVLNYRSVRVLGWASVAATCLLSLWIGLRVG